MIEILYKRIVYILTFIAIISYSCIYSEEYQVLEIRIMNHKFVPDTIFAEPYQKIKLIVHNDDVTPEEFESLDLRREKLILGNSKRSIHINSLDPGTYKFFGDFHQSSAHGTLVVGQLDKDDMLIYKSISPDSEEKERTDKKLEQDNQDKK